jgi:hypothetical protein
MAPRQARCGSESGRGSPSDHISENRSENRSDVQEWLRRVASQSGSSEREPGDAKPTPAGMNGLHRSLDPRFLREDAREDIRMDDGRTSGAIDLRDQPLINLKQAQAVIPPGRNGRPIHYTTLRRAIVAGELEALRIGHRWVTTVEAIQRWGERRARE